MEKGRFQARVNLIYIYLFYSYKKKSSRILSGPRLKEFYLLEQNSNGLNLTNSLFTKIFGS